MSRRSFRSSAVALKPLIYCCVLASLLSPAVSARPIPTWYVSYDGLLEKADLVVIAAATSTKDLDRSPEPKLIAQQTSFDVKATLKGKPPPNAVVINHYRLKESAIEEVDGRIFVAFRTKGPVVRFHGDEIQLDAPAYLLFLKSIEGNRFEPVTGQYDPWYSVKEIYAPLPQFLDKK
jgi:hypothetical protein